MQAGWAIRRRDGEWIAGAGGVALPVAMFLHWCSGPSAWQAFSALDVVLALLRSYRWRSSSRRRIAARPLPVAFSASSAVAGAVAAPLILYRIANQPGPNHAVDVQVGAWLGLTAPSWSPRAAGARVRVEPVPGVPAPPVEDLPGARSVTDRLLRVPVGASLGGTQGAIVSTLGVVLLLLSAALAAAEAHVPSHGALGGSAAAAAAGGIALVIAGAGFGLAAALTAGLIVGLVAAVYVWVVLGKTLSASRRRVRSGAEGLIGRVGEVRATPAPMGQVFLDGALWRARLWAADEDAALERGDLIVVERVDGLTLTVRRAEEWEMAQ